MRWSDAKRTCADLGDGWRLPSKSELNILYKNRKKLVVLEVIIIRIQPSIIIFSRGYSPSIMD